MLKKMKKMRKWRRRIGRRGEEEGKDFPNDKRKKIIWTKRKKKKDIQKEKGRRGGKEEERKKNGRRKGKKWKYQKTKKNVKEIITFETFEQLDCCQQAIGGLQWLDNYQMVLDWICISGMMSDWS